MDIQQVRAIVEHALKDGVLTHTELDAINEAIQADGMLSSEEIEIIQTIRHRIKTAEIIVTAENPTSSASDPESPQPDPSFGVT